MTNPRDNWDMQGFPQSGPSPPAQGMAPGTGYDEPPGEAQRRKWIRDSHLKGGRRQVVEALDAVTMQGRGSTAADFLRRMKNEADDPRDAWALDALANTVDSIIENMGTT